MHTSTKVPTPSNVVSSIGPPGPLPSTTSYITNLKPNLKPFNDSYQLMKESFT